MSHHGFDSEQERAMHEMMGKVFGEFPAGKLNVNDEGAIAMAVGKENERVVLRFPKPVAWVGLRPQEAMDLAADLIKWARTIQMDSPLTLSIRKGETDERARRNAAVPVAQKGMGTEDSGD